MNLEDEFSSAIKALEGATEALLRDRLIRRIELGFVAAAVALASVFLWLSYLNNRDIQDESVASERRTCMAINQSRADLQTVLTITLNRFGEDSESMRDFIEHVNAEVLQPLDC